jgi:hypothetical protein
MSIDYKKTLYTYEDYVENKKNISHLSDKEINKLHTEILKDNIIKKKLNHHAREIILEREKLHKTKIIEYIAESIHKISNDLYKASIQGHHGFILRFNVTESKITQYNSFPALLNHPSSNNIIYDKFEDYFNYLMLEIIGTPPLDTLDIQTLIISYLTNKIKIIFPHIEVQLNNYTDLLPELKLYINITIYDLNLIQ